MTFTYQDFIKAETEEQRALMVLRAVANHKASFAYNEAREANAYDHELNTTITNYVKTIIGNAGQKIVDITATNARICSNFFRRLNVQRNMYSLGNGLSFAEDGIKEKLGLKADTRIKEAGYYSLIHGVAFLFWNVDRLYVFPLTEFCPLWDEETGELAAGIRFWQIDSTKSTFYTLFEIDGYTKYVGKKDGSKLQIISEKKAYKTTVRSSPAAGDEIIAESNYKALPIVPLWGSNLHQSTLVGMQQKIDSYDLIASGFANDLTDCSQIYWIINNAGGMTERELGEFRKRLLFQHIANVDGDSGVDVKPYTQDIPYQSREIYLTRIRSQIYEDFGAFDCSSVSAAAKTATEINAAYQPMDENADDYEYQIIECVERLLALQGIEGEQAVPTFKRNRIANQLEQTQMIMTAAGVVDEQTIIEHLPWITPEEANALQERKAEEEIDRITEDVEI